MQPQTVGTNLIEPFCAENTASLCLSCGLQSLYLCSAAISLPLLTDQRRCRRFQVDCTIADLSCCLHCDWVGTVTEKSLLQEGLIRACTKDCVKRLPTCRDSSQPFK